MFYKPKFCNECGEKIARADWSLRHSRRFCDLCQTEHQVTDWVHRGSVMLLPILMIGTAIGFISSPYREDRPRPRNLSTPSVKPEGKHPPSGPLAPVANSAGHQTNTVQGHNSSMTVAAEGAESGENREQRKRSVQPSENSVYYCGAPTKKGTPCSRRVKMPGFCWQHRDKGD